MKLRLLPKKWKILFRGKGRTGYQNEIEITEDALKSKKPTIKLKKPKK